MFRHYWLPVFAASTLAVGCVPVTEPLGDVEKAEPDKELVGKWTGGNGKGAVAALSVSKLAIDAPEVKGNPKGLMRGTFTSSGSDTEMWFFVTAVGKHRYASAVAAPKEGDGPPRFGKEGAFAKWKETETKRYFVFRYALDGARLVMDCGDYGKFTGLMKDSNITGDGTKYFEYFSTPEGWLAKYLDKTGPEKIFDGTNALELKREKK